MSKVQIWHNPKCSKSRASYELLQENKVEFEVIEYLKSFPSFDEVKEVLAKLGMKPRELMRVKEDIYKELNLKDIESDEVLIRAMVANPKLIERPIVVKDDKAVIGRPIENVKELLT